MPTAIGTDFVTSISRRHIMPTIVDNIYNSNPFFFRLNAAKRFIQGGTQIEVPLLYSGLSAGGPYSGFELLDTTPSETIRNGVWGWKQHYTTVTVDGRTLIRVDSPEAIANAIKLFFAQSEMQMADNLGTGIFSDGTTDAREITGLQLAVDSAGTYGGLARATHAWWASTEDGSTTTLGLSALQTLFGNVSEGGRHPTIILSQQTNYNRYWVLNEANQTIDMMPRAYDEALASAGFTNLLFNGVPWCVDSHVHSADWIYMLNEDYIYWAVSPRADFYLEDFQTPTNQDAMVAKLLWAGELIVTNCARQGKMTAVAA